MDKELLNIFNLILQFKRIGNKPYEIDSESMFIIYNYWNLYGIKKYLTLKKFRQIMVEYSVYSGKDIHKSCEEFCKKINTE